jgi:hypothetical protein
MRHKIKNNILQIRKLPSLEIHFCFWYVWTYAIKYFPFLCFHQLEGQMASIFFVSFILAQLEREGLIWVRKTFLGYCYTIFTWEGRGEEEKRRGEKEKRRRGWEWEERMRMRGEDENERRECGGRMGE